MIAANVRIQPSVALHLVPVARLSVTFVPGLQPGRYAAFQAAVVLTGRVCLTGRKTSIPCLKGHVIAFFF